MMRYILGEDLKTGSVLSWGPGWYFQKTFFEGKDNRLSTAENLMRYDVEVSGFPSSHTGHIVLLGLKEQDYPGSKRIRSEEHTSELQSLTNLVCRLLLEKKKQKYK